MMQLLILLGFCALSCQSVCRRSKCSPQTPSVGVPCLTHYIPLTPRHMLQNATGRLSH